MTALALAMRAPWPRSAGQWLHIGVTGLLVHGVPGRGIHRHFARSAGGHHQPGRGPAAIADRAEGRLAARRAGKTRQWLGLVLGFGGVTLVVGSKLGGVAAGDFGAMLLPALLALLGITVGTLYPERYCPSFDLAPAR